MEGTNECSRFVFLHQPICQLVRSEGLPDGLYLDENCEETLVDSFSEKLYYVSHYVGVRVSVYWTGVS